LLVSSSFLFFAQCGTLTLSNITATPTTCANGAIVVGNVNIGANIDSASIRFAVIRSPYTGEFDTIVKWASLQNNTIPNIPPGTYRIMARAFCMPENTVVTSPVYTATVTQNSALFLATVYQAGDTDANGLGIRPATPGCNNGRILLSMEGGDFPYFVRIYRDAAMTDLYDSVFFYSKMHYTYNYYSLYLPAGAYWLAIKDGCGTQGNTLNVTVPEINPVSSKFSKTMLCANEIMPQYSLTAAPDHWRTVRVTWAGAGATMHNNNYVQHKYWYSTYYGNDAYRVVDSLPLLEYCAKYDMDSQWSEWKPFKPGDYPVVDTVTSPSVSQPCDMWGHYYHVRIRLARCNYEITSETDYIEVALKSATLGYSTTGTYETNPIYNICGDTIVPGTYIRRIALGAYGDAHCDKTSYRSRMGIPLRMMIKRVVEGDTITLKDTVYATTYPEYYSNSNFIMEVYDSYGCRLMQNVFGAESGLRGTPGYAYWTTSSATFEVRCGRTYGYNIYRYVSPSAVPNRAGAGTVISLATVNGSNSNALFSKYQFTAVKDHESASAADNYGWIITPASAAQYLQALNGTYLRFIPEDAATFVVAPLDSCPNANNGNLTFTSGCLSIFSWETRTKTNPSPAY
jgi:hypothetical protein